MSGPATTSAEQRLRAPFRWRSRSFLLDVAVFVLCSAVSLALDYIVGLGVFEESHRWAVLIAVLFRKRIPVTALAWVSVLLAVQAFTMDGPRFYDIAFLICLHAVSAYGPRWTSYTGLGVGFFGAGLAAWSWTNQQFNSLAFVFVAISSMVVTSWLLGYFARLRTIQMAQLRERAEALEREAGQQAEIAAAAERARIAREMHDVVAHGISVMIVQADGAAYAARRDPDVAVDALKTISQAGRNSLAQMRQLLGILRSDDSTALTPMPSAHDIPRLLDELRAAGLPITAQLDPDLSSLEPGLGLTVYRVVQEALTNTLKHAGEQANATVTVLRDGDVVAVEVSDDGYGSATLAAGGGHGLVGIRERVAAHQGTVDIGPQLGGGFAVRARLPFVSREAS